jgi:cell division protein FtsN
MAKKNQAIRNSNYKTPLPAWVWLLTGFAAGIGLSALLIFRDYAKEKALSNVPKPAPAASVSEMARGDSSEERSTAAPVLDKPKYDFYTALAEREVIIPDTEIRAQAAKPEVKEDVNVRYFLQLGSFPEANDADALKAQLALNGVQVQISEVNVNGKLWHRVRRGPFAVISLADTAKRDLMQSNISSTLVRENIK